MTFVLRALLKNLIHTQQAALKSDNTNLRVKSIWKENNTSNTLYVHLFLMLPLPWLTRISRRVLRALLKSLIHAQQAALKSDIASLRVKSTQYSALYDAPAYALAA